MARAVGFENSCSDEAGRLLHVLAGTRGRLRVAEIGSGAGVGAAWISSALDPAVPFFTAERDEGLASAVTELFRDDPNVHVLPGDWRETLPPEAPFDLLFVDAAKQHPERDGGQALGLLAPRGLAVLDDLTPGRRPDPVRDFWLGHPDLEAAELSVSPREAVLLAVRSR